jgi:hypothetical protein
MPIFRRTNCIITAQESAKLIPVFRCTSWRYIAETEESDDTRCCDNTICPSEDGHVDARNMPRIVM